MTTDAFVLLGLAGAVIVGLWIRMFTRQPREGTTQPEHAAGNGTGDTGPGGGHEVADASSTEGGDGAAGGGAGSSGAGNGGDGGD